MPIFNYGFSLIELLVTVAVLGIVLMLGIPSFRDTIAGSQVSSATNDFLAALNMTRAEAIRRGFRVTICKGTAAANQCDTSASSDWKDGWIVFVDRATQTPPQIEDPDDIIARGGGSYAASLRLFGLTAATTPTGLYASFTHDGSARRMDGGLLAGFWRVCSTTHSGNDQRAREIGIGGVGRSVVSKPAGIASTCPAP